MKEALLKKRYGIPALVLVILVASVAVAGVVAFSSTLAIRYPTHESLSIDLGNIPSGTSTSGTKEGFLGIPGAKYDLTWSLDGDLDKFSSVTIDVYVDMNGNGNYAVVEKVGTLTKTTTSIIKEDVTGVLETNAKYDISVTAKDGVEKSGTAIASDSATLNVDWDASKVA